MTTAQLQAASIDDFEPDASPLKHRPDNIEPPTPDASITDCNLPAVTLDDLHEGDLLFSPYPNTPDSVYEVLAVYTDDFDRPKVRVREHADKQHRNHRPLAFFGAHITRDFMYLPHPDTTFDPAATMIQLSTATDTGLLAVPDTETTAAQPFTSATQARFTPESASDSESESDAESTASTASDDLTPVRPRTDDTDTATDSTRNTDDTDTRQQSLDALTDE